MRCRPGCTWSGTSCPARPGTWLAPRRWPPGCNGAGPVTALAITCWLAGAGRFSSSRQAVRFAGLDITVSSSDRKGPPGKLSRQGPPVLRRAVYEAAKTYVRTSAPDHPCYAQVKDRKNSKRACLSEARKILRQAHHILAEPGDDALAAA